MRLTVSKYFFIATAAVFSVLVASLSAQTSASVAVTLKITDTTDSPLQNARVQITPTAGTVSKPMVTNNKGEVILHLESGVYDVHVSRWGFQSLDRHINVQGPKAAILHLTLQLPFNGSGSPVVVAPLPLHTSSVPLHELIPDLAQTPKRVPVTLQAVDVSGAHVPYAEILLIPSPAPAPWPGMMEADGMGHLALNLKQGEYSIAVYSPGFKRLEEHLEVIGSEIISLKLQVGGCAQCVKVHRTSGPASHTLLLRTTPFQGRPPITFNQSDLSFEPHVAVTIHNSHTSTDETYSGVPLIDLIEKIGVAHGRLLSSDAYIVATGSDGYKAVLSLAEVDPEFHPGKVIVADEMNGRPLNAKIGAFELIVTEDKLPLRSVPHLVSIDVRHAE